MLLKSAKLVLLKLNNNFKVAYSKIICLIDDATLKYILVIC